MAGVLCCPVCSGPMYRHTSGAPRGANLYYRCNGPDCCNMPRLDVIDAMVSKLMEQKAEPIMDLKPAPGSAEAANKLAKVRQTIKTITSRLPIEEVLIELPKLDAQRKHLEKEVGNAKNKPVIWVESDTGETYAEKWARLGNKERNKWLRERVQITGRKIYAWAGHKEGDEERLLAAIGKPGCAIATLEDMPPLVNEVYLLFNFKLMTEDTKAAETLQPNERSDLLSDTPEEVTDSELDRLAAMGRSEWNVGSLALVPA